MPAGDARSLSPAAFEFVAPGTWKMIDFISDLHLCAALPATFAAWSAYLHTTPADAVLILGDLFEVWVGDDARQLNFESRCVDVLAEAASRKQVALMVGNRDFLMGAGLLRACGAAGLPDPTVLSVWGQRFLLTHGDALCLDDVEYQQFRLQVRSTQWQQEFLSRTLADRVAIAADIRRQSRTRQQFDGAAFADVDAASAVGLMHTLGTAQMVHGHTHRPGSEMLAPGYKRHVLSDWDLDEVARPRAQVLRLTRDGFARVDVRALSAAH